MGVAPGRGGMALGKGKGHGVWPDVDVAPGE